MKVIDPATEQIREIEETAISEIPAIVSRARDSAGIWREVPVLARAERLRFTADLLAKNCDQIAQHISTDMGKPLRFAKGEVQGIAEKIKYLCSSASAWLSDEQCGDGIIRFEPLGVAAVISPWNYPVYTALTGIFHALLAGNSVVFKPSEYSLFTGKLIGELFQQLQNLPKDLVLTVVGGKEHGRKLISSEVDVISFTGSTAVGKEIVRTSAERMVRLVLELGGMDAAIVLGDVDIESTASSIVRRNARNTGQVCCSIKRVFVEKKIFAKFSEAAATASRGITFGDPRGTYDMGPLAGAFQRDKILEILADAVSKGAKILSGGRAPEGKGFFFPSTVLVNVSDEMRIMNEEAFGPILPILAVEDWEEGVARANSSRYGLTGSVWTKNIELGRKIASRLEVGNASINGHAEGGIECPWGGAKESGIGRTNIRDGMRQFTNIKYIHESSAD